MSTSILREANKTPSRRKRRHPTEDHKLSCVKRMENESTSRLAKEMGVAPSTLREWRKEYISSGKLPSPLSRQKKARGAKKGDPPLQKPHTPLPGSHSPPEIPPHPFPRPHLPLQRPRRASRSFPTPEQPPLDPESLEKLELMTNIGLNPAKLAESPRIPLSSPGPQDSPKLSQNIPSPPHSGLDEAIFRWFERSRHEGLFISCARLKSEATSLNKQLSPTSNFIASEQWLSCWKARYGVRYLPETLEKVTTDKMGEKEFTIEVNRILKDEELRKCQVFNCCEISWSWKNLPRRSSAGRSSLEHCTGDYVTVMGFCNADLSMKLPLVILRRPGNVQVLENKNNLPLYSIERNEPWMFSSVLGNWFRKDFVPVVTQFLENRQLPPKAILIVDDTRFLPTNLWFGDFKIVFLPQTSTCLMRPFYQNPEKIKTHCKKTLVLSLALHMDCDKSKGVRRHLQGSITIVNLLNWIYTAWENNKGEKPRQVLESLKSIDGFKDITVEELNEWLEDSEEDDLAEVLEEAVEIVQTPDMSAYVEGEEGEGNNGEIVTPGDAVRYLDSVIEFFCHYRNLSETDLAALRLARETANNISCY
ncbi:uncharacterized protein LOC135166563 [Diachasmimorpha longicaudata]|uniref:uncharacterized protein LOC135166563 n=1 Tax=Diachasmimorpha longicaudata TaxID=58733 RepID=UPI0030B8DB89